MDAVRVLVRSVGGGGVPAPICKVSGRCAGRRSNNDGNEHRTHTDAGADDHRPSASMYRCDRGRSAIQFSVGNRSADASCCPKMNTTHKMHIEVS